MLDEMYKKLKNQLLKSRLLAKKKKITTKTYTFESSIKKWQKHQQDERKAQPMFLKILSHFILSSFYCVRWINLTLSLDTFSI